MSNHTTFVNPISATNEPAVSSPIRDTKSSTNWCTIVAAKPLSDKSSNYAAFTCAIQTAYC